MSSFCCSFWIVSLRFFCKSRMRIKMQTCENIQLKKKTHFNSRFVCDDSHCGLASKSENSNSIIFTSWSLFTRELERQTRHSRVKTRNRPLVVLTPATPLLPDQDAAAIADLKDFLIELKWWQIREKAMLKLQLRHTQRPTVETVS